MAENIKLTIDEVKKYIDKGKPIFYLDTRNPHDWGEADQKVKGAHRIHYSELEKRLNEIPREGMVLAYCT